MRAVLGAHDGIVSKIFTPFFTTTSRGSGPGLPTVKRFVEAQDGEAALDSPPAGGTTILIRPPTAGAASEPPTHL